MTSNIETVFLESKDALPTGNSGYKTERLKVEKEGEWRMLRRWVAWFDIELKFMEIKKVNNKRVEVNIEM